MRMASDESRISIERNTKKERYPKAVQGDRNNHSRKEGFIDLQSELELPAWAGSILEGVIFTGGPSLGQTSSAR